MGNPLKQFEIHLSSSEGSNEALLVPREEDEECEPFPTPSTQFSPVQDTCSHVQMPTRCCRLDCSSCTCSNPCLRARTCPAHQHGDFHIYLHEQLLLTGFQRMSELFWLEETNPRPNIAKSPLNHFPYPVSTQLLNSSRDGSSSLYQGLIPFREETSPNVQAKPPLAQVGPFPLVTREKRPTPTSLSPHFQRVVESEVYLKPPFLQAKQPHD